MAQFMTTARSLKKGEQFRLMQNGPIYTVTDFAWEDDERGGGMVKTEVLFTPLRGEDDRIQCSTPVYRVGK
jgi:hypothetical protein